MTVQLQYNPFFVQLLHCPLFCKEALHVSFLYNVRIDIRSPNNKFFKNLHQRDLTFLD